MGRQRTGLTKDRAAATPPAGERQLKGRKTVFPMTRLKLTDPAEGKKRQIEGYAAVFGNRDAYGDVIVKGAFERTLRERPDVKVLYQHDTDQPIGRQIAAFEDEFGLRAQGELSEIPLVNDTVIPLLQDGVITGLSIGYDVVDEEYNGETGTWFLKDIDLWEWSPVTFPANELATVLAVKELGSRKDARADDVIRHAKALGHLLGPGGYFEKDSRRDALDFAQLEQLHALIGGTLPGVETSGQAADAGADEIKLLEGAHMALDLIAQTDKE